MEQTFFFESISEKYTRLEKEIRGFSLTTETLYKAYCLISGNDEKIDTIAIEAELLKSVEKDIWDFIQQD